MKATHNSMIAWVSNLARVVYTTGELDSLDDGKRVNAVKDGVQYDSIRALQVIAREAPKKDNSETPTLTT